MRVEQAPPDRVERSVIAALTRVDHDYQSFGPTSGPWTRAVKNAVGTLGAQSGFVVYAANCNFEHNGEWLYDLTWSDEDPELTFGLPLVLESEWEPKDILWDFSKLVTARARHRVMVFWGGTPKSTQQTLDLMVKQIEVFRGTQQGDRCLFCYWVEKPDQFNSRVFVATSGPTARSTQRTPVSLGLRRKPRAARRAG